MRLKDGDALREAMYHEAFETDSDMQKWDSGCWIRYKMFENVLEAAPTIEADPVKRGRWIRKPDPYGFFADIPVCSECGCTTKMRETYRFCPNCGARMEAEEGEAYEID